MSRRIKPLSSPVRDAISILAHVHVAAELSQQIEGLQGFANDYIETTLSRKERQVWDACVKAVRETRRQLANDAARDQGQADAAS